MWPTRGDPLEPERSFIVALNGCRAFRPQASGFTMFFDSVLDVVEALFFRIYRTQVRICEQKKTSVLRGKEKIRGPAALQKRLTTPMNTKRRCEGMTEKFMS